MRKRITLAQLALALTACQATPSPEVPATFTAAPTLTPVVTPTPRPTVTPTPEQRLDQAWWAWYAGDWDRAAQLYRAAAADEALAPAAQVGLGRTLIDAGQLEAAERELAQVLERYPDSPQVADAHFLLAESLRARGFWDQAATGYRLYLDLRPGFIDSYVHERLAAVEEARGDPAAVTAEIAAAVEAGRADGGFDLREQLAGRLLAAGDVDGALAQYAFITAQSGQDLRRAQALVLTGDALLAAGRSAEAYATYADVVATYPRQPVTLSALRALLDAGQPVDERQRGLVNYYAANYEPAIAAFNRYLGANPRDGEIRYTLGQAYAALEQTANAVTVYQALAQDLPGDPFAAQAALQLGELLPYPQDVEVLEAFVAAQPGAAEAPAALTRAARFCERNDDLACAARLWSQTANDYPDSEQAVDAAIQAGIVHVRQGDPADAASLFEQATTLGSDATEHARAWVWLGKVMTNTDAARGHWAQAVAAAPDSYYGLRAQELIDGVAAFTPPASIRTVTDEAAEVAEAETWLRTTFPDQAAQADLADLPGTVLADPAFIRGAELWRLGDLRTAHGELDGVRRAHWDDPVAMVTLAAWFSRNGVFDLAIRSARQVIDLSGIDNTMSAPRLLQRWRFPLPFFDQVREAGAEYDQHPFVLYAKMRIESFFWKYAFSSAQARGLNQIIPGTADQIARDLALDGFTQDDLYRPVVSIPMGAYYLSFVGRTVQTDTATLMAGYYAGPGNAQRWIDLAAGDPDLFVEVIRLPDAKYYVQTTFEFFELYKQVYGIE
jgi:soluble lytic murein transglycosylase